MRIRLLAFCALPLLGVGCAADDGLSLPESEQIEHTVSAVCDGDADAAVPDADAAMPDPPPTKADAAMEPPPPPATPTWPVRPVDPGCENGFQDWGTTSPCQRPTDDVRR